MRAVFNVESKVRKDLQGELQVVRPAYSLMELLAVIALLVILAAVAYPSIEAMYQDVHVQAAADAVRGAWALARSHAIDDSQPYRFAVIPGGGHYKIAPDVDGYWGGDGSAVPAGNGLVIEGDLPAKIPFSMQVGPGGGSCGQWSYLTTFLPDGTARDNVTVILELAGCQPLAVRLRALTGSVTVGPVDAGGG